MKAALTTILLAVLVLGGCASSTASNSSAKDMTDFKPIGEVHLYKRISDKAFILSMKRKRWNCGTTHCHGYYSLIGPSLSYANQICVSEGQGVKAKRIAGSLTRNTDITFECLTEEENKVRQGKIIADAYKKVQERENTRALMEEMQIAEEKKEMLEKLEIKKEKCRTYGFKDETDGMGMCLIELDKLAEIEKQTKSIEANSIAQAEAIAQQEAKEKNRREAQALINLGNALSGKGKASCSFKCSGGQVVQGSCQKVTVSVGSQTCWKQ